MAASGDIVIKVTWDITGETVATLEMQSEEECHILKRKISSVLSTCTCKIVMQAGAETMRNGLKLKRYIGKIAPNNIVTLILQTIDVTATSIAQLFQSQVCFKCMKEAGANAEDIFKYVVDNKLDIDAIELRRAGFNLSELVQARHKFNMLVVHPPVTTKSLFDSQLKLAGYSAEDFRTAGYHAHQLSYVYFWAGEGLTVGEADWEQTCAFFSDSELREAGYDDTDLQIALFTKKRMKQHLLDCWH